MQSGSQLILIGLLLLTGAVLLILLGPLVLIIVPILLIVVGFVMLTTESDSPPPRVNCADCGAPNEPDDDECHYCGAPL